MKLFLYLAVLITTVGCAAIAKDRSPKTLEQMKEMPHVKDRFLAKLPDYLDYMIGVQYALAINEVSVEEIDIEESSVPVGGSSVQAGLAVSDIAFGNYTQGLVSGFTAIGKSISVAMERTAYNASVMAYTNPRVHYYKVVNGDGRPSAEDLDAEFDDLMNVFNLTYNVDGSCHPFRWDKVALWRDVLFKDVPGVAKFYQYGCYENSEKIYTLGLHVFANPKPGVKSIALLELYYVKPELDSSSGLQLALSQRNAISSDFIEIIVDQKAANSALSTVASYKGKTYSLPQFGGEE